LFRAGRRPLLVGEASLSGHAMRARRTAQSWSGSRGEIWAPGVRRSDVRRVALGGWHVPGGRICGGPMPIGEASLSGRAMRARLRRAIMEWVAGRDFAPGERRSDVRRVALGGWQLPGWRICGARCRPSSSFVGTFDEGSLSGAAVVGRVISRRSEVPAPDVPRGTSEAAFCARTWGSDGVCGGIEPEVRAQRGRPMVAAARP